MKLSSILLLLTMVPLSGFAKLPTGIAVIPGPVLMTEQGGHFVLPNPLTISAPPQAEVTPVTDYLKQKLQALSSM